LKIALKEYRKNNSKTTTVTELEGNTLEILFSTRKFRLVASTRPKLVEEFYHRPEPSSEHSSFLKTSVINFLPQLKPLSLSSM